MNRPDRIARAGLSLLQDLLADYWPRNFSIRMWDGATWEAERGMPSRFTLVFNHPSALRALFQKPRELSLAEAYLYRDVDVEGDINGVFGLADHLIDRKWALADRLRFARRLLRLPAAPRAGSGRAAACLDGRRHSRERDRRAISYHYDVSNDFFSLWLDRNMVYSCGYFTRPDQDLDTAQTQKLDYLCRKLRLRSGDRLLDIGCGWGGLLLHAARHYGVEARGITLSREQAILAKERISREGLGGRCSVDLCDYRDVRAGAGFDKLVSVGMFEHVGRKLLPSYFRKAWSLLKPGGVFLNHGIAERALMPKRRGPTFTERYVFPDGELVPVSVTLSAAELIGFEVRDVESLREHYALTLRQWVRRLEEQADKACSLTNEVTYRTWRLSMAASAHGFSTGKLNVYQSLLVKPVKGASGQPLTRADWYGAGAESTEWGITAGDHSVTF